MICGGFTAIHSAPLSVPLNLRAKVKPQSGKDVDDVAKRVSTSPKVIITSAANPFVKHCLKLRLSSSYRHLHESVVVVGTTPIREIYQYQELAEDEVTSIESLLVLDKADIPEGLACLEDHVVRVSSAVMKKISGLQSTESVEAIAVMKLPKLYSNVDDDEDCSRWFPSAHRILVLEGIQDPGNMGTLLRTAMAFKWGGAFLLPGCCDPFNEKALRASRGASFQLPIISGNWTNLQTLINHYQMKPLAGHPDSNLNHIQVSKLSPTLAHSFTNQPLCLVLGSEGSGLSQKATDCCQLVSIPMSGEFESLNVSVAGGIFLYMLQS